MFDEYHTQTSQDESDKDEISEQSVEMDNIQSPLEYLHSPLACHLSSQA